jgi:hypothetical protein
MRKVQLRALRLPIQGKSTFTQSIEPKDDDRFHGITKWKLKDIAVDLTRKRRNT